MRGFIRRIGAGKSFAEFPEPRSLSFIMSDTGSDIGLGCVTFGREIDEATAHEILDYAFERGITFLDSAAAYANGASEVVIGSWLESRRPDLGELTVATKFQPPFSPEGVLPSVEESLERLGVSRIDLLYLHQWDESAVSVDFLAALDGMVRQGLVARLGISNCNQDQLELLLGLQKRNRLARFRVLQNNFNYAVRDVEPGYREFCRKNDVAVVTYSPLGAGFLTGKHRHGVERGSRFDLIPAHQDVYFHEESEARLSRLEGIARRSGHSQAQLALAWAMHQPGIDTVLVGARTTAHLDQAIRARAFAEAEVLAEMGP